MKKNELFLFGIGTANFYLFLQFIGIAQGVVGMQYLPQKRPLSFVIGLLVAFAFSSLLFNFSKLLGCLETNEEDTSKKIILSVGRRTIFLLSVYIITTLLLNFFLYR